MKPSRFNRTASVRRKPDRGCSFLPFATQSERFSERGGVSPMALTLVLVDGRIVSLVGGALTGIFGFCSWLIRCFGEVTEEGPPVPAEIGFVG